jgi:hypothetical protein
MTSFSGMNFTAYWAIESVEGTTDNNAGFSPIGHQTTIEAKQVIDPVKMLQSGAFDYSYGTAPTYTEFTIKGTAGPDFDTFIKTYFRSDTPLTVVCRNGAGQIVRITGAKIKSTKVSSSIVPNATAFVFELVFWGWTTMLFAESSGTPTYASVQSGFKNWSDLTVNPGSGTSTIWRSVEMTIDTKLEPVYDNTGKVTSIKRGPSTVTGNVMYTDDFTNTEWTDLQAGTTHTFSLTVTGLSISIANTIWSGATRTFDREGVLVKSVDLIGGTPTLT